MAKNQNQNAADVVTHIQVKISQAISIVTKAIKAKKVVMIHGSPAIGKSAIVMQIAEQYNLKLIDLRLSQCDPTDLLGFPRIQGDRAGYVPMDTFPIEGDALPIKTAATYGKDPSEMIPATYYTGWLLFLDEFNSASVAVQAAAYKIVLDRMVGKYSLHKHVAVVAAGNLETDGAIVEQMSTALQSRLIHIELAVDVKEWINWASKVGIDHRIQSFINFKPALLYTFKPDHCDRTYAAPRTWQFADDFMKDTPITDPDMVPLLSGTITEGVAREFILFCDIYRNLPTINDLVAAPMQVTVSVEPSILFAITGMISAHATAATIDQLMKYVSRLPIEFQVVCMRMTLARNYSLYTTTEIQKWIEVNAVNLF